MTKANVCILMATYNGELFLQEQLQSILKQTYTNWELYIGDDDSNDETLNIINHISTVDNRIHLVEFHDDPAHGQLLNFKRLINYIDPVNFDYVMFADQDDVWYETKIEHTLSFMLEVDCGPTLVYTNFDENDKYGTLKLRYDEPFQQKFRLQQLLLQNWIMGCTMMINPELLLIGKNIPVEAVNHDNWLALVAMTYGKIKCLTESTMMHRIHENNVTNNISQNEFWKPEKRFFNDLKASKKFRTRNIILMEKLSMIEAPKVTQYAIVFLNILKEKSKVKKIWLLKKNGLSGLNIHKTIKFWLMI